MLHCERCDSWGYDTWAKETGARMKPRRYQRAKAYQEYLAEHDRNTARLDIMAGKKEVKGDGVHHPGLRLVPKAATATRASPLARSSTESLGREIRPAISVGGARGW
jgi:hypothetical protein